MNCEGTILVSLESTEDELPTKGAYFSTEEQDAEEAYFQSTESEEKLTWCSTMGKVASALEVLQPISLILSPHFGWNGWIGKGAYLFLLGFLWDPELYNLPEPPARAAFWVASGMVLASSFVSFFTTTDRTLLIKMIRASASPVVSFPAMQMFLSRIVCNGNGRLWLYPAEECFTFPHMVEGAVGCLCFGLLCFMCLGFAIGSHTDTSVLVFKVVISLCFHLFLSKKMVQELALLFIVLPLCVAGYIAFVANASFIAAAKERFLSFAR